MPFDSIVMAKYLLALAQAEDISLNNTQLQKILFIAYGYFLAKENKRLVEEHPSAWPYGPVFPRLTKKNKLNIADTFSLEELEQEYAGLLSIKEVLIKIIKEYSKYSAGQLSDWSHKKGSPWDRTVEENEGKWNGEIIDKYIKDYFLGKKIIND